MSSERTLRRLAVVGIGGVAIGLSILTNTGAIASAKPSDCSVRVDECRPIPPDTPDHPGQTPMPQDYGPAPDPGSYHPIWECLGRVCLGS